ncbi:plastocyanin domain-containing protein [Marinobacter oulmenensis]|uniref:Plastocyanin domain-containing protein n=1 Tax=Marinobacter oulmenensis TaxID=643747 RepID=A0A840UFE1_9GAMM|nr:plastocyanin domain-containing protein [Marinobacter oulmenensis]
MLDFLVNAGGIALMAATIWWFWLSGSDTPSNEQHQHHH